MWVDLQRDLLEEFAAVSWASVGARLQRTTEDTLLDQYRIKNRIYNREKFRRERSPVLLRARAARAAARPPCPGCGCVIERLSRMGQVAKSCSRRCAERIRDGRCTPHPIHETKKENIK